MKEFIPAMWDDLDLAEKGAKTPGDVTARVCDPRTGDVLDIDLSGEHYAELSAFMDRYLRAVKPVPHRDRRKSVPGKYSYTFDTADVRKFANHPERAAYGLTYRTKRGDYYYNGALMAAYDAWKAGGDWREAFDDWRPSKPGGWTRAKRLAAEQEAAGQDGES